MKSRLKKLAMDPSAFEGSINQVSQKGRDILKLLQEFKFTLEQTGRLLNNDQQLSQGMIQKRKQVDELSNKLYQIVFDVENIDISNSFISNSPVVEDVPTVNPTKNNNPTPENEGQGEDQIDPSQSQVPQPSQNPQEAPESSEETEDDVIDEEE